MNQDQIYAIKCALADLAGALEQHRQSGLKHDWDSHACTIQDLYDNFKDECNLEYPAILEEFEDPSDYVGMDYFEEMSGRALRGDDDYAVSDFGTAVSFHEA